MKRLFIILAFIGSAAFNNIHAADNKATPVVEQSFENAYSGAKNITWKQVGDLYKASFVLDNQYVSAFYNSDGELVAVTKNISSLQLPQKLQKSLKNKLGNSWIGEVFVVNTDGKDTYFVKMENADTAVLLKSYSSNKWAVYQKNVK